MEELHGGGGFGARVEWGQSMELLKEERNRRSWLCHSSWLLRSSSSSSSSSSSFAVTYCNTTTTNTVDISRNKTRIFISTGSYFDTWRLHTEHDPSALG